MIGGSHEQVALMSVLLTVRIARGILLDRRQMMADMIAFITEKGVKSVLDTEVFSLVEAKSE